ncbi:hypothetical protein CAter282_2988 [Collimonas arenae]|uniref:Uncharacterized protein n=1 Tax=Collimonas arenae TaxID=279058 RepID=A0A127PT57_9BURK|nr:hypothetical protein CAter10_3286 [Collimonas arenae]AMP10709.1 hypothetical protein CAter282_2988 [Collimonas arenae]
MKLVHQMQNSCIILCCVAITNADSELPDTDHIDFHARCKKQ